jgi:hypothetical protein
MRPEKRLLQEAWTLFLLRHRRYGSDMPLRDRWSQFCARGGEHLRLVRQHWTTFAAVAGLCILATGVAAWIYAAHRIKALEDDNDLLADRIEALAASAPSQWRRLNDRARDFLLAGLQHPDSNFKLLVVYAAPDSEARQYASQFIDAARLVGLEVRPREAPLSKLADVGLMIGISTASPSEQAQKLREILSAAGLEVRFIAWPKSRHDDVPVDFALFVGPKPW